MNRDNHRLVREILAENRRAFSVRECTHPAASRAICNRIIAAHTIQRRGPLRAICDETGHALTFSPRHFGALDHGSPQPVGWRQASTFSGFCGKHDQIFGRLEQTDFTATREQCFLATYRAVCHEDYMKRCAVRAVKRLAERMHATPREFDPFFVANTGLMVASRESGASNAGALKSYLDRSLVQNDYRGWNTTVFFMEGEFSIASAGCITPDLDLTGRSLQDWADLDTPTQTLVCTTLPTADGVAISMSHLKKEEAPGAFIAALSRADSEKMPSLLAQILFAHIENTFFSKTWWEGLRHLQKVRIQDLAMHTLGPGERPHMVGSKVVPWRLANAQTVDWG